MAEIGKFFVTIGSKFEASGINKSISKIKTLEKQTENAMKGFRMAGAALTAFATAGAVSILKLTNHASDLEETTAKFNTVFEGQEELARSWADTLVASYGVSTEQAKRFLGSIQDLLVPMGMNAEKAGKLSNEVVQLSVDLGSFNNLPTEKVMMDIQSALVGNFETMKKYGVVLNATKVEQEIMNAGWVDAKADITQAMKAQAAYNLIIHGSQAALGDFNRTADGYANQVKTMQAGISDLAAKVGTALIPTMKQLVGMVNSITSRLQAMNPETVNLIAKVLLVTTAIAGIAGPMLLLIGFLPQIAAGFASLAAAVNISTIASTKLFAVLAAHPFVAVAAALAALTLGVAKYWEKSLDAADATRELGKTTTSLINIQKTELENLKKIATDSKATAAEREAALTRYEMVLKSVRLLEKKAADDARIAAEAKKNAAEEAAAASDSQVTAQEELTTTTETEEDKRTRKRKASTRKTIANMKSWLKSGKNTEQAYTDFVAEQTAARMDGFIEHEEGKKEIDAVNREEKAEIELTELEQWAERNAQKFEDFQSLTTGMSDTFSAWMDMKSVSIQNDLDASISKEDADYAQQREHIINNVKDEAERKKQLNQLETSHSSRLDNLRSHAANEEKKARSKMKPLMIAQAIANTAVGATKALATGGFPLGAVLAALATAAGMFQVAKIKAQKFAQGGLVNSATPAIFGEAGQEIALPLKSPTAIEALSSALRKAMGVGGLGTGGNIYVTVPPISTRGEARRMGDIIGDEIVKKIKRNRKL